MNEENVVVSNIDRAMQRRTEAMRDLTRQLSPWSASGVRRAGSAGVADRLAGPPLAPVGRS